MKSDLVRLSLSWHSKSFLQAGSLSLSIILADVGGLDMVVTDLSRASVETFS